MFARKFPRGCPYVFAHDLAELVPYSSQVRGASALSTTNPVPLGESQEAGPSADVNDALPAEGQEGGAGVPSTPVQGLVATAAAGPATGVGKPDKGKAVAKAPTGKTTASERAAMVASSALGESSAVLAGAINNMATTLMNARRVATPAVDAPAVNSGPDWVMEAINIVTSSETYDPNAIAVAIRVFEKNQRSAEIFAKMKSDVLRNAYIDQLAAEAKGKTRRKRSRSDSD